jgi:hypothetical protein
VDYRDLIRDVLDSIESGLEHEQRRGAIRPEEAEVRLTDLWPVIPGLTLVPQDLLRKLRNIKTKRDGLS